MATTLTTHAVEESTYIITAAFADENGDAVIPSAITWTLTDRSGTVINFRDEVAVAVPAALVNIVLSGDDLAGIGLRILTVQGIYDSASGSNLPLNDEVIFMIDDVKILPRS